MEHLSLRVPTTELMRSTTEAWEPEAHALQQGKPPKWEARALQLESGPCLPQLEKARAQQWNKKISK